MKTFQKYLEIIQERAEDINKIKLYNFLDKLDISEMINKQKVEINFNSLKLDTYYTSEPSGDLSTMKSPNSQGFRDLKAWVMKNIMAKRGETISEFTDVSFGYTKNKDGFYLSLKE
jgi:hypothetical protein